MHVHIYIGDEEKKCYNEFGDEKKGQETGANDYSLPIPLEKS